MDLDLRKIRYFVAVAEQLSFVQAAAELHLTQPALSRQIQALERGLGTPLFTRDRRGTALTAAGRQLLTDAHSLLSSADTLQRRVRAAARGTHAFTVGFMPGVPSTTIIQHFAARHPELSVTAVYVPMEEQEPHLLDGEVDVCFVRLPLGSRLLRSVPLFDEPRVAVVPADARQAAADQLTLSELAPLPLLDPPMTLPAWRGDSLPRRRPLIGVEERLQAVAVEGGFTVLPEGIARYHHRPDVALVRLTDLPPVPVALAYNAARVMPGIEDFAQLAVAELAGTKAPIAS